MKMPPRDEIILSGHLKKLKSHCKKFFVLIKDGLGIIDSRLEYYENERKFLNKQAPKLTIRLAACSNIERRWSRKHHFVIGLRHSGGELNLVYDNEDDFKKWMQTFHQLQSGDDSARPTSEPPSELQRRNFEHVWKVHILKRGLGTPHLIGEYRMCMWNGTLSFLRAGSDHISFELKLCHIRSCGNLKMLLYLEMGRISSIGTGELWMKTADNSSASHIHNTLFQTMCKKARELPMPMLNDDNFVPTPRFRSASATEFRTHNSPLPPGERWITPSTSSSAFISRSSTISEGTSSVGSPKPKNLLPIRSADNMHLIYSNLLAAKAAQNSQTNKNGSCNTSRQGVSCSSSYSTDGNSDKTKSIRILRTSTSGLNGTNIMQEDHATSGDHVDGRFDLNEPASSTKNSGVCEGSSMVSNSPSNSISSNFAHSIGGDTPKQRRRFADYTLDKVASYLSRSITNTTSPIEDATPSTSTGAYVAAGRPLRCFSVGSKPTSFFNSRGVFKPSASAIPGGSNSVTVDPANRKRAFSVGSKYKRPYTANRILELQEAAGLKSNSAPILSNKLLDDLMEIDFSIPHSERNPEHVYEEMTPSRSNSESISAGTEPNDTTHTNEDNAVDEVDGPVNVRVPPHSALDRDKCGPTLIGSRTNFIDKTRTDYVDMSAGLPPTKHFLPKRISGHMLSTNQTVDSTNLMPTIVAPSISETSAPEGYVEMTCGVRKMSLSNTNSREMLRTSSHAVSKFPPPLTYRALNAAARLPPNIISGPAASPSRSNGLNHSSHLDHLTRKWKNQKDLTHDQCGIDITSTERSREDITVQTDDDEISISEEASIDGMQQETKHVRADILSLCGKRLLMYASDIHIADYSNHSSIEDENESGSGDIDGTTHLNAIASNDLIIKEIDSIVR